jgi:hypothetical protein
MKKLLSAIIVTIFCSANLFSQGYQIKCSVTSDDSSTKAFLMSYGNAFG